MKYRLTNDGDVIADSLTDKCTSCINNASETNATLATKCPLLGGTRRRGLIKSEESEIFLCSPEKDDVNSKRNFRAKANAFLSVSAHLEKSRDQISTELNKRTRRLIHNLTTINAQSIQELYNFIPQDVLTKNIDYQLKNIQKALKSEFHEASKLFLRITKNNLRMKTEFSVFKTMYEQKSPPTFRKHAVQKVVLNVLHTFFSDFTDHDVRVKVQDFPRQVDLDYETFSVAIFHIIENAAKYIMPNSTLSISFSPQKSDIHITFEMLSLPVRDDEVANLCTEGFSGELAHKLQLAGDGIGMFRTKRLLRLNNGDIIFENNIKPRENTNKSGFDYEWNRIRIILNRGKKGSLKKS